MEHTPDRAQHHAQQQGRRFSEQTPECTYSTCVAAPSNVPLRAWQLQLSQPAGLAQAWRWSASKGAHALRGAATCSSVLPALDLYVPHHAWAPWFSSVVQLPARPLHLEPHLPGLRTEQH